MALSFGSSWLQQALLWLSLESFECESVSGKHHRASYRRHSSFVCSSLFELIHDDIWGLAYVSSVSRFRYYIVFIDDYSHVSWVYLLKYRVHVPCCNQ